MFFHALAFAGSGGSFLNTRLKGQVLKHLLRDPASVNAMKQTCVIVILAYFTVFQPKFALKTLLKQLNIHFLTLRFSKQNVGCKLSNAIMSQQRHSRMQRISEQKHQQNDQSGLQCFLYITSYK